MANTPVEFYENENRRVELSRVTRKKSPWAWQVTTYMLQPKKSALLAVSYPTRAMAEKEFAKVKTKMEKI